jgi:hypothetical protein
MTTNEHHSAALRARPGPVPAACQATLLILVVFMFPVVSGHSQTTNPSATPDPNQGTNPAPSQQGGGQLEQIAVTGYILPRLGDGPQPVTTIDQDYIQKHGEQTVQDVINSLPQSVGYFSPVTTYCSHWYQGFDTG